MFHKSRFLLLLLLPLVAVAQKDVKFTSSNFKSNPKKLATALDDIKQGDYFIQIQEYGLALPFYLSADSLNHNNADLETKIGLCYLNSNDYKARSLRYFKHACALTKKVSPRMPYFLGCGYHLNYNWDSAIIEFNSFIHKATVKEKKDIEKYIEECNNGKDLMQHPVKAVLKSLGPNINSEFKDYCPFLTADESEIVFTSKRPNTTGGQIDPGTGEYFEDIYISHLKNGEWEPAENIGQPINTTDNDATAYLTPDGQKIFIFRDINGGDIYVSSFSPQGWSNPEPLNNKINSPYDESSVCLSPDRKVLYFVSDRPGGKGGKDIYKSYLQPDSSWGTAINMGDTINTEFDEEGVFIHPDGKTMYFSSKGHNTMGGYDIFKSVYENGVWSIPQNMGYPINSPDDDVFFMVSASGQHGYYASAKDTGGYGALDIYQVSMESLKPKLIVIKGTIADSVTRGPLMASIKLINKTEKMTMPSNSNESTGAYVLSLPSGNNYEIDVHADGYPDYTATVSVADTTTYREVMKNIYLLKPGSIIAKTDSMQQGGVASTMPTDCALDRATILSRFAGFTKDTVALLNMVNHLDSGVCLKTMMFTVQIGAYHFPRNFKYKQVEIKPVAVIGFSDGISRFTMGSFNTYKEAADFRAVVVQKGIKDAFVSGVCNGRRVLLTKMLHPNK